MTRTTTLMFWAVRPRGRRLHGARAILASSRRGDRLSVEMGRTRAPCDQVRHQMSSALCEHCVEVPGYLRDAGGIAKDSGGSQ